ncbi:hypothetical protein [Devosia aquimaris]|nr:hypothetical protein [Devosia sp. CJK-A8-3]
MKFSDVFSVVAATIVMLTAPSLTAESLAAALALLSALFAINGM